MEGVYELNKRFDKQSMYDPKYKIHKEIFNLTLEFTARDWRTFRTKKYWTVINSTPEELVKLHYLLKCIKYYTHNKIN